MDLNVMTKIVEWGFAALIIYQIIVCSKKGIKYLPILLIFAVPCLVVILGFVPFYKEILTDFNILALILTAVS